jgi:1-acyl-sn-glycerol-3-phosphate acyltransferase
MTFLRQIASEMLTAQRRTKAWPITRPSLAPAAKAFFGKVLYRMGRSFLASYMHAMLDVDIQWQTRLPEGPKILAANHPTTTDPFYILTLLSEPVSVLVTAATFDIPILGRYLRATGHVPAIRGSGGATVEAVARQVEAGRTVAIFPEGALSPLAGGFHRPHSGVARVALRTGAPVIPVGIGLQRDRIRITETDIDGKKAIGHLYTSGPYAMTVGRPLYFEGNAQDREGVRAASEHIMHHIRSLARESKRRIDSGQASAASSLVARGWRASPAGAPMVHRGV